MPPDALDALPPEQVLARLTTRGFRGPPLPTILRATLLSMLAMSVPIALGAHVFVSMAVLLGVMVWVLKRGSGRVDFALTADALHQRVSSSLGRPRTVVRRIPLDRVRWYRVETDMTRDLREVEQLTLRVHGAPGTLWITDEHAPGDYARFRDAFAACMAQLDGGAAAAAEPAAGPAAEPAGDTAPAGGAAGRAAASRRRPGFYQTRFARLLAVLFALCSLALGLGIPAGLLSAGHALRLGLLIVPGTGYLLWRCFGPGARGVHDVGRP